MKDFITPILLIAAIYSGIVAASSHNLYVNILMGILCGVACAIYSRLIKDNKDD